MFISPRDCPDAIRCDVAVVGAGPAGMALALDLAGLDVDIALLSAGTLEEESSPADAFRPVRLPDHHVDPASLGARRFGGLSWSWGGRCVAFDEIDFEPRPELGLPGWPIDRAELMCRAADAAAFLGIGPPEFGPPGSGSGEGGSAAALERWCAEPRLARTHRAAFASPAGPRVLLGITCTGAALTASGRVSALRARSPDGRDVTVTAERFVLAAGGIETARLLLWIFADNGRAAPRWTGRGYMGHLKGQIAEIALRPGARRDWDYALSGGCYIRRRFALPAAELRAEGLWNTSFHIDNPPLMDPSNGSPGLSAGALALAAPFIGARLMPAPLRDYFIGQGLERRDVLRHLINVARRPFAAARFGRTLWRGRRSRPVLPGLIDPRIGGRFALTFNAEQSPRIEDGIALVAERDPLGIPRVSVERSISDAEVGSVVRAHRRLAARLRDSGLGALILHGPETDWPGRIRRQGGDGYHQIGLARMGVDPEASVTDRNARVHGIGNLFVAGSAVFPRSGQASPTFSAICQALRLARHLKEARAMRRES